MNEWMNESTNKNENERGEAWEAIVMKKDDIFGRFERFKRLRYQPTNQPTDRPPDGHDLL